MSPNWTSKRFTAIATRWSYAQYNNLSGRQQHRSRTRGEAGPIPNKRPEDKHHPRERGDAGSGLTKPRLTQRPTNNQTPNRPLKTRQPTRRRPTRQGPTRQRLPRQWLTRRRLAKQPPTERRLTPRLPTRRLLTKQWPARQRPTKRAPDKAEANAVADKAACHSDSGGRARSSHVHVLLWLLMRRGPGGAAGQPAQQSSLHSRAAGAAELPAQSRLHSRAACTGPPAQQSGVDRARNPRWG